MIVLTSFVASIASDPSEVLTPVCTQQYSLSKSMNCTFLCVTCPTDGTLNVIASVCVLQGQWWIPEATASHHQWAQVLCPGNVVQGVGAKSQTASSCTPWTATGTADASSAPAVRPSWAKSARRATQKVAWSSVETTISGETKTFKSTHTHTPTFQ